MKNSDMKRIMESWRGLQEDVKQEVKTIGIIKEEITKAILDSTRQSFSKEDKRLMKEHKLTESQVQQMMDEGRWDDFKDKLKSTAAAAKDKVKKGAEKVKAKAGSAKGAATDAVAKLKRMYQGAKEIGLGGAEATNLGGEETFDIEKRKAAKARGEAELERSIAAAGYKPIDDLFNNLLAMDWPNFKGKSRKRQAPDSKETPPEVNEGRKEEFKKGVDMIQQVYNQIVDEYNSSEKTEKDAEEANKRIAALRDVPIYFMDYVLADRGSYLNEAEEGAVSKNYQSVYAAKLPLGLAVAGAALAASGLKLTDPAVKNAIKTASENLDGMSEEIADNLAKGIDVRSGEGWTQAMQRATSINMAPDAPIGNLLDPKVQNLSDVLADAFTSSEGPETMEQVFKLAERNPEMTFAELFKKQSALSGRGKIIGDLLAIEPGSFFRNLTKPAIDAAVKTAKKEGGKALVKATAANALGPIIGGLGIAGIGGAAVSALMRAKGKYGGSQMASLQKMVNGFKDVKAGEGKEEQPQAKEPQATEPQATEPQATEPQATEPQATEPQAKAPAQKGKDAKTKSGPKVPVFKKGPRPGTSGNAALQKDLVDIDLPSWATHFITKAVAGQMRASGFQVQENFVAKLEEFTLPFSSQSKIDKFLDELPPEVPQQAKDKIEKAATDAAEKQAKKDPNNSEEAAEDATDQIISKAAAQVDKMDTPPQPVPSEEEPEASQSKEPFVFNLAWIKDSLVKRNEQIKSLLQQAEKTNSGAAIARLKSILIPDKKINLAVSAVERFVQAYNANLSGAAPKGVDGLEPADVNKASVPRNKSGDLHQMRLPESLQDKWKKLAGLKG